MDPRGRAPVQAVLRGGSPGLQAVSPCVLAWSKGRERWAFVCKDAGPTHNLSSPKGPSSWYARPGDWGLRVWGDTTSRCGRANPSLASCLASRGAADLAATLPGTAFQPSVCDSHSTNALGRSLYIPSKLTSLLSGIYLVRKSVAEIRNRLTPNPFLAQKNTNTNKKDSTKTPGEGD